MTHRYPIICAALVPFLLSSLALAAETEGVSIEAMTCDAELSLHVKLTKVEVTKEGPPDMTYYHCTADVLELLHGKLADKTVTFTVLGQQDMGQPPINEWLDSKDGLIVFLSTDQGYLDRRLKGELTPINAYRPCLFNLSKFDHAYDANAHFITDPKKLLPLIRATAKALDAFKTANPDTPTTKVIDLGSDSEVYKELWGGSGVAFRIPAFPIDPPK